MALPTDPQNPSNNPADQSVAQPPKVGFVTKAFASGLFSGFSPVASGTVGSAVGLAFYCIPGFERWYILLPASLLVLALGIKASDAMEKVYGHDPGEVTIDEVLGMWVSLLFLPKTILVATLAFFIFRILDIVKPFPARRFDNLHGGSGVMLDDVVSAIYTNLLLQLAVALQII
ncbi:MAG: phosphatidylglycerophosphatase A [Ignavibacteriales bacterium]|nr:phosphatidylglycerophosphatase A [Ignavibacteriales bacterium]